MATTPISTLALDVQQRLEETPGVGTFWSRQFEIYSALVEACSDLLLLVGRPTQTVQVQLSLTPNTVWQSVPKGVFLISNIWASGTPLRKADLHSMDYVMSSWGPDWTNDISDTGPKRWLPLGLTKFAVHPAPSVPVTVVIDGIAYPTTNPWPYTGAETVPFSDEFFVALEMYASVYARLKEGGQEFQESLSLYNSYLQLAKRMSDIQDRRDSLIFSSVTGAPAGLKSLVKR